MAKKKKAQIGLHGIAKKHLDPFAESSGVKNPKNKR